MLSEATIIKELRREFPQFIGDDAAVIEGQGDQAYVITKDLLIENIHFRPSYVSPKNLAQKALHVNLSDLAAMGAHPQFILCGIGVPDTQADYTNEFLLNLSFYCKEAGVVLIGGDTTRSPDSLFISITAIGIAAPSHIKYRKYAASSNLICVIGNLGYAHLGLLACEKSAPCCLDYQQAFLCPTARIKEGVWLGLQSEVTSMMDISDGLWVDLQRLCQASNVAGVVEIEKLPWDEVFANTCQAFSLDPLAVSLTGGEDYGLLFTLQSGSFENLADNFLATFGYPVKCIGGIVAGSGVHCTKNGKAITLSLTPFTHFGENP